jgi:hypothetical protein
MPIRIEEGKTPKGQRCMRALVSGHVSLTDAQEMGELLKPGHPYHQSLVISIVDKSTDYSPESRKYFGSLNGNYKRMASVVTSGVLRAAINFMMRITGAPDNLRMFNTEAEAYAWLDEA